MSHKRAKALRQWIREQIKTKGGDEKAAYKFMKKRVKREAKQRQTEG